MTGASIDDLDKIAFYEFINKKFEKYYVDLNLPLPVLLSNLKMIKEGNLTLGGLLLFGKNPQVFKPTFTVHCIAIKGNDIATNSYRNKKNPFQGNLKDVYEKTLSFVIQNLKETQVEHNFNSQGKLEIAIEVIIELLVNALVHRDFFINSSIKVFTFDNRIEIISPGKLPNSLNIENIKTGTSVIRNPILYSNVSYLLPFQGVGSGIRRAFSKYRAIELINDTERELFISIIKRPKQN